MATIQYVLLALVIFRYPLLHRFFQTLFSFFISLLFIEGVMSCFACFCVSFKHAIVVASLHLALIIAFALPPNKTVTN